MNEHTAGREEARRALERARSERSTVDKLLESIRTGPLAQMRESRERNHFADKMRAIIRGDQ